MKSMMIRSIFGTIPGLVGRSKRHHCRLVELLASVTFLVIVLALVPFRVFAHNEITSGGEIGYLDFESGKQYNELETIAVNSSRGHMSIVDEKDGNHVLGITTDAWEQLGTESGRMYFSGFSDEKYRISMRFYKYSGVRTDIVLCNALSGESNQIRLGYIRLCTNDVISAYKNYTANFTPSADSSGVAACTADMWHTLEGVLNPVDQSAVWYLDGKEFSRYISTAAGGVSYAHIQAVGTQESVEQKTPVLLLDDLESGMVNENSFAAMGMIESDMLYLRFTEYPISFHPESVALSSTEGSISVAGAKQLGKRFALQLNCTPAAGKSYTVTLPAGMTSSIGNVLQTHEITVDIPPEGFEISVVPTSLGGIFMKNGDIAFELTVRNTGIHAGIAAGYVSVNHEDGTALWQCSAALGLVEPNAAKSVEISPRWMDQDRQYGRFYLSLTINVGTDIALHKMVPFSVVYSNGIQNPRMGATSHYVEQYATPVENFAKEIALNAKAGFGLLREDLHWSRYEATRGEYMLTIRQRLLYESLLDSRITPYNVLTNGSWAYGTFFGTPVTQEQLFYYGNYVRHLAQDTLAYAPIFEIGNEWNSNYWGKSYVENGVEKTYTVQQYVDMMEVAYTNVKEVRPNAMVVGLTVASANPPSRMLEFIEACLQFGAANYCDAISIHPYSVDESPEAYDTRGVLEDVRALLAKYGVPDMPIILSEWGWTSSLGANTTEEMQAVYSVRGAALVGDLIHSLIWYEAQEHPNPSILEQRFGMICDPDGETPLAAKPLYIALCCFNSLTGDKTQQAPQMDEHGNYICRYIGPDEITIQVWNPNGESDAAIDASSIPQDFSSAMVFDMYGNHRRISVKNGQYMLSADEKPIYLVLSKPEQRIRQVEFEDLYGRRCDSLDQWLEHDGAVAVTVVNTAEAGYGGEAIVAGYADGVLRDIQLFSFEVQEGIKDKLRFSYQKPGCQIDEVRAFVWHDHDALLPIMNKRSLV